MLSQIKKGRCLGLDDTQIKLIMPKELPDKAEGIDDPQIKRLIEKMIEAKKEKKDSLDAKMWGYSSFDSSAPYDKAYLMREDFNRFWTYSSPAWASKFLRDWCTRANRPGIEPLKSMAKMLERHEPLLLNWFEARGLSSGIVEGFNNKAKLTVRKSNEFKDVETISTALYHQLGDLPEPIRTHRFG